MNNTTILHLEQENDQLLNTIIDLEDTITKLENSLRWSYRGYARLNTKLKEHLGDEEYNKFQLFLKD